MLKYYLGGHRQLDSVSDSSRQAATRTGGGGGGGQETEGKRKWGGEALSALQDAPDCRLYMFLSLFISTPPRCPRQKYVATLASQTQGFTFPNNPSFDRTKCFKRWCCNALFVIHTDSTMATLPAAEDKDSDCELSVDRVNWTTVNCSLGSYFSLMRISLRIRDSHCIQNIQHGLHKLEVLIT